MKKPIKIEWLSMSGFGPSAWDRDTQPLNIHTPHSGEEDHLMTNPHHAEHLKKRRGDSRKKPSKPKKSVR